MTRALRIVPLILLAALIAGLAWRLASPPDTIVRSRLEGQPLPDVAIGPTAREGQPLKLRSLAGQPMVVNFFASWCVPCIAEAPVLAEMETKGVRIVGIAVRDRPEDIRAFLTRHGDPYATIGTDPQSEVQIALGSSGVPESFVVDARGVIRYQHIGPIEPGDVPLMLAELEKAK